MDHLEAKRASICLYHRQYECHSPVILTDDSKNALITATVATCVTWPNVKSGPIGVLACWYSTLLMSIMSITCAIQQSNALFKLGCRDDGKSQMRKIMQSSQTTGATRESRLQHFIWQSPIMLLNFSILIFVIGLLILVFSHALLDDDDGTWKEKKVRASSFRRFSKPFSFL